MIEAMEGIAGDDDEMKKLLEELEGAVSESGGTKGTSTTAASPTSSLSTSAQAVADIKEANRTETPEVSMH